MNTVLMTLLQVIPKCILKLRCEAMKVLLVFFKKCITPNFNPLRI